MEKNLKKIKVFVIILLAILLSLIAFCGVFKFSKGVWNDLMPSYKYGMDIGGSREIRYDVAQTENEKYVYVDEEGNVKGEVWKDGNSITAEDEASSTEEGQANEVENASEEVTEQKDETDDVSYAKETRTIKENPDEFLTKENFEKVKKIIQKRLDDQEISEYNIRIDDVTGKLVVETANDDETVEVVESLLGQAGKFQIIDYQNGVELMNNSDIKNVSVVYSNNESYNTYLQIEFNKSGAETLKEISKKYVEIKEDKEEKTEESDNAVSEEATSEGEETETEEEETTKKYVSIVLDGSTMMTTYFGEEMTQGILQIQIGNGTTDTEQFIENQQKARRMATVLNTGIFPVKYNVETDNFVKSQITKDTIKVIKIACLVGVVSISIMFIIRFKEKGLLAAILSIGYISLMTIVVRYTNVPVTLNSLISFIFVVLMNYVFINMFLNEVIENKTKTAFLETFKKFYLNAIPVCVVAIVFTFATQLQISSIGMILFWGIVLMAIYNVIFTRTVFKDLENK